MKCGTFLALFWSGTNRIVIGRDLWCIIYNLVGLGRLCLFVYTKTELGYLHLIFQLEKYKRSLKHVGMFLRH